MYIKEVCATRNVVIIRYLCLMKQMKTDRRGELSPSAEGCDSYGHVLKYTGLFGGVQGLKIFVNIIRNKLAAMLLHKSGLGLNAQYMNSAEVSNSFTNFGLGFSAVQRLSELYENGNEANVRSFVGVIRTWSLFAALCGVLLTLALSVMSHGWYYPDARPSFLDVGLLCLFVASIPMEEGECSILKGMRKLPQMAVVESVVAISTLVLTVPVYYFLGVRGIVLALALGGWAKVLIHMNVSFRLFRYRVYPFSSSVLAQGWQLVVRGVPFMLAAVFGSLTTLLLFQYCLNGSDEEIGLYKSAYSLMVTYTGIVFVAIGNDFFPRLSSVNHDVFRMNHTINQQIDVCVLLITPLLIVFALAMPFLLRLLYSSEFLPAVIMAQCAVFYMFFQAVTKPLAYASLAKGESLLYLLMEALYNVVFVVLMYYGYRHYALMGAGVALSLAALFDILLIGTVYALRYGLHLRKRTCLLIFVQGLFLALVVVVCVFGQPWMKYVFSISALLLSVLFSYMQLRCEGRFMERVRRHLLRRP